jgi:hypothetical protein
LSTALAADGSEGLRTRRAGHRDCRRATFPTCDARLAVTLPAGLADEQAAAVTTGHATAWHGLHELARIKAGAQVFIHSATRDVAALEGGVATKRHQHVAAVRRRSVLIGPSVLLEQGRASMRCWTAPRWSPGSCRPSIRRWGGHRWRLNHSPLSGSATIKLTHYLCLDGG